MKDKLENTVLDMEEILSTISSDLVGILPNIISALIFLVLGTLVAFVLKRVSEKIVKGLARVLPDTISEKSFVRENLQYFTLGIGKVLFFITIFFTVLISLKKVGMLVVANWLESLGQYLPNIFGALLIIILGWKAKSLIEVSIDKGLSKAGVRNSIFMSRLVSWSIFVVSALVSIQQLGLDISLIINLSSILLGVISLGVALMFSLGAKDSISDILYCYQLNKFLKVGQTIEIKTFKGKIESIGPVFVLLRTEDASISIPGKVFSSEILSFSKNGDL